MSVAKKSSRERGDTLVEVMVALTVLAIATTGIFSLMNRGVVQMYDGMERTQVRSLLDRQTEMLTYARDQYLRKMSPGELALSPADDAAAQTWAAVKALPSVVAAPNLNDCSGTRAFYLNRHVVTRFLVPPSSGITHAVSSGFPKAGDGIWIQKINSPVAASVPYIDFYIRSCWKQGSSPNNAVISSIVRLYYAH